MEPSELGFVGSPKRSMGTVFIVGALLFAGLSCAASAYLYLHHRGIAREKKELEALGVQLQEQVQALKQHIESDQRIKTDLKAQLETLIKSKETQTQELAESKAQAVKLQTDFDTAQKESSEIKKVLETLRAATAALPPSIAVPASIAEIVKSRVVPESMKIKTINRKFNFVVLSLASGKSLKPGDALRVERAGQWVADLSVQKIYDQFASALIKKESQKDTLQVGDSVK